MGKVSEFNRNGTHVEQLVFFQANRISDELHSSCGIMTYKLFKGLTALLLSHEKSFDELKQLMLHHQIYAQIR